MTALGNTTKWFSLGRWAANDGAVQRASVNGQSDADGNVYTDTYAAAAGRGLVRFWLRVTPHGAAQLNTLSAMASRVSGTPVASAPLTAQGITLNVPQYSQRIHAGEYPQWGGGGEAWCSPTSTSMVLSYWGSGPTPADYAWVDPSYPDRWVDHAVRQVFDYTYQGAGNWPFNTAYAGTFGLRGFITRLRSLNEAELFIAAGIPLVMSLSFKKNQIPGLSYDTAGHLLVLVGFTASGQPVLNDPNSASDGEVRKPVGRAEFELAWLGSSKGVVYVIHPGSVALPARPSQPNW